MATTRKRKPKKVAKARRTTKAIPLTKIDYWAIACNEVYLACKRAGMDDGTALAFSMDRASHPDWIVDPDDPIRKPWSDDEEED